MNRTGLFIALAIAVVVGLVFGLYPQLDVMISAPFHDVSVNGSAFGTRIYTPLLLARDIGLWISTAIIVPVVAALVIKLLFPRRELLVSGRAVLFLITTLALGPGLLVNVTLKNHWGRPRPIEVTQFGGEKQFVAWWDPRGTCDGNCSFVSGDVSGAIWTVAPAALVPPPWRALAYGGALALGTGMAVAAHHGGRTFLHRHGVRRRFHLPDYLGHARPDLSLAAHAHLRRGRRARYRTRRPGEPRFHRWIGAQAQDGTVIG